MYTCIICKADNKTKTEMAVDSSRKSGLRSYCKKCHNEQEVKRRQADPSRDEKIIAWQKANPNKMKQYKLNRYNITSELYDSLIESQNFLCKICSVKFDDSIRGKRACVDHDHLCCPGIKSCGQCIRIICDDCNTALGKFKDNIESLKRAINYLEADYVEAR